MALIGRLIVGQRQHRRRGLEGAAAGAGFACVAAVRFAHAQASRPIRATVRRGTGWSAGAWLLLRQCVVPLRSVAALIVVLVVSVYMDVMHTDMRVKQPS